MTCSLFHTRDDFAADSADDLDVVNPLNVPLLPADTVGGDLADSGLELCSEHFTAWKPGTTLVVSFLEGTAAQHDIAKRAARTWAFRANIDFDFVIGDSGPKTDIRVGFDPADKFGLWSHMGVRARGYPGQKTMNLGDGTSVAVALHEFGHALGFFHEHLHPQANIDWDRDAAIKYYRARNGWSEDQAIFNLFTRPTRGVRFSTYETTSIMHYEIPAVCLRSGSPIPYPLTLSSGDQAFAEVIYPFSEATIAIEIDGTAGQLRVRPAEEARFRFNVARAGAHAIEIVHDMPVAASIFRDSTPTERVVWTIRKSQTRNAWEVELLPGAYVVRIGHGSRSPQTTIRASIADLGKARG